MTRNGVRVVGLVDACARLGDLPIRRERSRFLELAGFVSMGFDLVRSRLAFAGCLGFRQARHRGGQKCRQGHEQQRFFQFLTPRTVLF